MIPIIRDNVCSAHISSVPSSGHFGLGYILLRTIIQPFYPLFSTKFRRPHYAQLIDGHMQAALSSVCVVQAPYLHMSLEAGHSLA